MKKQRSTPTFPYRLDELGWLQFDHLCSLLLQVEAGLADVPWRAHSDRGRVAVVEDQLVMRKLGIRFRGPVTVAALWVRGDTPLTARLSELVTAASSEVGPPAGGRLVVFTNLDADVVTAALSCDPRVGRLQVGVVGAGEIAARLDRRPE